MSAAGLPKASPRAQLAASYATPPVLAVYGAPVAFCCTVTCTPHGACAFRWAASASLALFTSLPGGTRRLTFARADASRVLEAAAPDGAAMPMTGIAGGA